MEEPGLVFEVKLLQILQRDVLLLLAAAVQQPLHTALKHTGGAGEPEGSADRRSNRGRRGFTVRDANIKPIINS